MGQQIQITPSSQLTISSDDRQAILWDGSGVVAISNSHVCDRDRPKQNSGCSHPVIQLVVSGQHGCLLTRHRFSFGQLMASVALQRLGKTDPFNYKTPIYTQVSSTFAPRLTIQWAQIGIMFCIYLFLPESPAWCATRSGKEEMGKKMLLRLNKGVSDYDVDRQWEVLVQGVRYEEEVARETKTVAWYNIFRGQNGVSPTCEDQHWADISVPDPHQPLAWAVFPAGWFDPGMSLSGWPDLVKSTKLMSSSAHTVPTFSVKRD